MSKKSFTLKLDKLYFMTTIIVIAMYFFMPENDLTTKITYLCIGIGLLLFFSKHKITKKTSLIIFIMCILYVIYIFINIFFFKESLNIATTKGRMINTICIYLSFLLIPLVCHRIEKNTIDNAFYFLMFIAIFFTLKTYSVGELMMGIQGLQRLGDRLCGINSFGMFHAILSIFCCYKMIEENNKKKKMINAFFWILFLFFALTSGSRKALLGSVLGFLGLSILYVSKNKKSKMFFKISIVGILLFYIFYSFGLLDGIIGRLFDSNNVAVESDKIRTDMISIALQGWKNHILFGNGFNSFILKSGFNTYSHNNYVELLYNVGLVGTIIFYFPKLYITIIYFKTYLQDKRDALLVFFFISELILLLFDFACVSYYSFLLNYIWWIAGAYILNKQYGNR